MNTLALLIHFGTLGASGVVGILINLLVFALVILIIFWILGLLGVPENIRRIIGAILALLFILSLFTGCASGPVAQYQSTVQSRTIGLGADYSKDSGAGVQLSDSVTYR